MFKPETAWNINGAGPYSLQCVMRKVDKLSNLATKTDPLQFKMRNITYETEPFDVNNLL